MLVLILVVLSAVVGEAADTSRVSLEVIGSWPGYERRSAYVDCALSLPSSSL